MIFITQRLLGHVIFVSLKPATFVQMFFVHRVFLSELLFLFRFSLLVGVHTLLNTHFCFLNSEEEKKFENGSQGHCD